MALSQFVKLNQLDFAEQKATSCSADLSSLQESGVELVPENGRIVVQGQSAKAKSGAAATYILSSQTPMNRENCKGNSSSSRTGRIFLMDSTLDEIGRLDYSLNESLQQDLSSVLVPEVTGLAASELPAQKNSVSKVDSWSYAKAHCPVVRPLVSGSSDIMVSHASNNLDSVLLDSLPREASAGIRVQKPERSVARSDPGLLNFSHFTRPIKSKENKEKVMNVNWICLANVATAETSSTSKKETDLLNQLKLRHAKIQATAKTHNDVFPIKEPNTSFRDGVMNNHNPYGVLGRDRAIKAGTACSSMCSGNSPKKNSNDRSNLLKRKYYDGSRCQNEDIEDECTSVNTTAPGRGGTGLKRSREHNLSDRKDKIDEKMLALQDLIPNCNKMDKASMLDEAIEYLKTLQLQLQIMSMGTGFCMPQMMYPVGMPASQMQHFPLFGLGMGMRMGFGMHMQSMNGVSPVCPFPIPHMQQAQMSPPPFSGPGDYPSFGHPPSSSPTTFPPIAASNFPTFGHPGLCPPIPTTEAPTIPPPATNSVVGTSASKMEARVEVPCASITKMR
ncbi:unnamed protein product [Cuscuta europaea]|uniref:BHLH domain-containing protein n=1 Tax=Cuscuta europaea TaxID=41803 RepID=A0A9P0ZFW7_CUSEU|nr:unnamed protein product [Cuscuta europaea]